MASRTHPLEQTYVDVPWREQDTVAPRLLLAAEGASRLDFLRGWERYRTLSFLGAGGMGQVLKAFDPRLNRLVALKFLHSNDPQQLQRFLREARAQARVDHEHVCRVYETGEVEGHPYIAMQYVEGETVGEWADRMSTEQKAKIVRDVAEAVHAGHRMGLIHRDLKPGNILIESREDGSLWPFVVDFGLALDQQDLSISHSGAITGTPAYLSPEQAQGQPVDRRTDVYGLGVVLYELLTGEVPIRGVSIAEALMRVVSDPPLPLRERNPRLPQDLETITMKCLEKEPQARYDSARALADDLNRFLDGAPILARPASRLYRAKKWLGKNRLAAAALAASLLILVGALFGVVQSRILERQRSELIQRFEREVAKSESEMRQAVLLPLHDLAGQKLRVLERMERIRAEMPRLGQSALGPGQYALGKSCLALYQYEQALEHLEAAWQSGDRRPEVALALAEALRRLHQKALLSADPSLISPGITVIPRGAVGSAPGTAFQQRALAVLREGVTGESSYRGALLDFFSRRFEEARLKAAEVPPEESAAYDARQLEAEIAGEEADQFWRAGDYQGALAAFEQSGKVYAGLLEVGRSDPNLYASDCGRLARVASLHIDFGHTEPSVVVPVLERALARCDRALEADRELSEAHTRKAYVFWLWGRSLQASPSEARAQLERAIASAERAVTKNSREVLAFRAQALANTLLAQLEFNVGGAPWGYLDAAESGLLRALAIQPTLAAAADSLGVVHRRRASYQQDRGQDPRGELEKAVDAFGKSIELDPANPAPVHNRGLAFLTWAEVELEEGLDPSARLERALADFEASIRQSPGVPKFYNNLALVYWTVGEYHLRSGQDALPAYDQAIETLRRALALNPSYKVALPNLASSLRGKAASLVRCGANPTSVVAEAERWAERALVAYPDDFEVLLENAQLRRVEAEWLVSAGRRPEAAFVQARKRLEEARKIDGERLALSLEVARLTLAEVQWLKRVGRPAEEALIRGLEAAERGLASKPNHRALQELKAELLRLQGSSPSNP